MTNEPAYLTTRQVAQELGLSRVAVRKAISRRTLLTHQAAPGTPHIIDRAEVERYRREHRRERAGA